MRMQSLTVNAIPAEGGVREAMVLVPSRALDGVVEPVHRRLVNGGLQCRHHKGSLSLQL